MSQDGGEWTNGATPDRPVVCRGVRGATTSTANTREAILEATADLVRRVIDANGIQTEDIASVIFSTTPDLTADFPALIRTQFDWHDVALECFQEMAVPHALPKCIRVLIHWNTTRTMREIEHVYLRGAENLRPDRVKPKL
jgi:chorismate mutase